MSKKAYRSQASSSRAVNGAFGGPSNGAAFGSSLGLSTFGAVSSSPLSYVYEPPDLTGFSEPNVGVAFKNIQKKDGITKSKALEDLHTYISSLEADKGGLEEAMLEAWITLYPRTCIDLSRRVRQLAHTVQGQIALSCGKRMGKHMPTIVASWLAGLYDNDKSVSRAASDAFTRVFPSEEKQANVWRIYQSSILEYSRNVILKETIATLSDERTVSPDDASTKHSRVTGAAIMITTHLLEKVPEAGLRNSQALLDRFLNEDKVWKLATHADPFVRRALYRLLCVALTKQKGLLNPSVISANILASGLHASQVGSASDFAKVVSTLSVELPDVWTLHYTGSGKKSAQNRLCYFLRRGSQGGPPDFWTHISKLISSLPPSILLNAVEDEHANNSEAEKRPYSQVLNALHEGLSSKDEPRSNQSSAWECYLDVFELVQASLPESANRQQFYTVSVFPILIQYVRPSPELSRWIVPGIHQKDMCLRACNMVLLEDPSAFGKQWHDLSGQIIEDLKTSLPEQSKEYSKSQDSLSAETNRWYQLQGALLGGRASASLRPIVEQSITSEIESTVGNLKARNGKPYGAAAALEASLQWMTEITLGSDAAKETLLHFVNHDIPDLVLSPSAKHLIRILNLLEDKADVTQAYEKSMRNLADAPESPAKANALQTLISSKTLAHNESLFSIVLNSLRHAFKNDDGASWNLVMAAVVNPAAPKNLTDDILAAMVDRLTIGEESSAGLHGLEMAAKQKQSVIKDFASSTRGPRLLSTLLVLSEYNDSTMSQRAKDLSVLVEQAMSDTGHSSQSTKPLLEIVRSGISTSGTKSLSVDSVVSRAQNLYEQTSPEVMPALVAGLLPDLAQWTAALNPFIARPPNPSLAITNPFGGALSLISPSSPISVEEPIPRDGDGYSSAFRMVLYTTKLIETTKVFEYATSELKGVICKHLALFLQLAGDNLSISGSVPLWDCLDTNQEFEIVDLVAGMQKLLASWLQANSVSSDFLLAVQAQLLEDAEGLTAKSYYSGRAYSAITTELREIHGHVLNDNDTEKLKMMRMSVDVFAAAGYLTSTTESKEIQRLGNELLADLTGLNLQNHMEEGLRKLVILSCISNGTEDFVDEIPHQRLVFFVKHGVQQLGKLPLTSAIGGQLLSVLTIVLRPISEIYGEYWADILDIIQKFDLQVAGDDTVFGVHASLRLLALLRKLQMQESNDDLLDAWTEKKGAIAGRLLELVTIFADTSDESHQPRQIANHLLGRELTSLSVNAEMPVEKLYPVLGSKSAALQETAYKLLHTHIPSAQEHISVDKALSADYIPQLPEELLSLILAPPTMEFLAESNFERTMPTTLRSYLLSWKLTFDHWRNASYKVQADYVAALQEGTYVQDFLSLALNILISGRAKPVDASKFDIENYTLGQAERPETETHWLLIHLYYLSLRHLPSITKTWWRDTVSRQLNIAVGSWTEKHISPLIIASELTTISDWAPSQATADQPMTIKVSLAAREITASIPIDEQTMTIAIHLPKSYPLTRAEVTSVHRVGVAEKKWNFWLINTQGVINFSSGGAGEGNALIDGLLAWRKNVTAAMKGQAECAICYSVVSADRQLPSKKCQTCKNTFHSSCLFKWFKSSNSSSCPLCRNAFHYS